MVMQSMRSGKASGFLKYILFTLLGLAVGGLALSGSFNTGSAGNNNVANIEGKKLSIRDFDLTLRRALSRYNVSPQQAYKIGLTEEVLTGEIRSYFLLNEAENLGIEIGKNQLSQHIAQIVKPNMQEGETLQDTLDRLLSSQNISEKLFINSIKKEVSSDLIMTSIKTGFAPSVDLLAKDLYIFQAQTREIDLILFPDSEINTIEPATSEQLQHLYNATKSINYKIPEYRSANIATFDMSTITTEFTTTDEEVKSAYDENLESFAIGERLVLSQAILQDEQKAKQIYSLTQQQGVALKDAITQVMGEDAAYIENVDFETSLMLPELNDALESRDIGKIVPPVKTALGHHVVKLIKILPPSTKPFSAVKAEIKRELTEAKKSDYLYDIATNFDELLNEGTSFEEIANKINVTLSTIEFIDNTGLNKLGKDGLESFDAANKKEFITSLFELEDDVPATMLELDKKLIAISINTKQEKTFKTFEAVAIELANQFMSDQRRAENRSRMQKHLAELSTQGSTFDSIANDSKKKVQKITGITIDGDLQEPLNNDVRPIIFKTKLNDYQVITLDGGSALIKISNFGFPEMNEDDIKKIDQLKTDIKQQAKDEAVLMYLQMLGNKYSATINRRLLDRVYGEQDDN